jgi:excisionase family DNA binding protein
MLNEFDLLTLTEVAKLLHCSKAHVGKVVSGRVRGCPVIPCVRLGRRKLVRRESLVRWLKENENGGKMGASPEWGARRRA